MERGGEGERNRGIGVEGYRESEREGERELGRDGERKKRDR